MDSAEIVTAFKEGMERAGLTPRDVSPLVGMSHTTLYRILSGRASTSLLALRAMQMFTKFLKWYVELKEELERAGTTLDLDCSFGQWLEEK